MDDVTFSLFQVMKLEIITTHTITDFSALNPLSDISPRKVRPAHPDLKK